MDEFGLVWLSSVWFDEVDLLKCSRSASQLSFTNLFLTDILHFFSQKKFTKVKRQRSTNKPIGNWVAKALLCWAKAALLGGG